MTRFQSTAVTSSSTLLLLSTLGYCHAAHKLSGMCKIVQKCPRIILHTATIVWKTVDYIKSGQACVYHSTIQRRIEAAESKKNSTRLSITSQETLNTQKWLTNQLQLDPASAVSLCPVPCVYRASFGFHRSFLKRHVLYSLYFHPGLAGNCNCGPDCQCGDKCSGGESGCCLCVCKGCAGADCKCGPNCKCPKKASKKASKRDIEVNFL